MVCEDLCILTEPGRVRPFRTSLPHIPPAYTASNSSGLTLRNSPVSDKARKTPRSTG